jgi:hypothetical protein
MKHSILSLLLAGGSSRLGLGGLLAIAANHYNAQEGTHDGGPQEN